MDATRQDSPRISFWAGLRAACASPPRILERWRLHASALREAGRDGRLAGVSASHVVGSDTMGSVSSLVLLASARQGFSSDGQSVGKPYRTTYPLTCAQSYSPMV